MEEIFGFMIGISIFFILHKSIIKLCEKIVNFVTGIKYY